MLTLLNQKKYEYFQLNQSTYLFIHLLIILSKYYVLKSSYQNSADNCVRAIE